METEPFVIDVPDAVLEDLRARLAATRWPDQLPGSDWELGTDEGYLRDLCTYWRDEFDWRAIETALGELDHHMTTIAGQRIHFVHVRSPEPDALPLLLLHGWPSTFGEFVPVLGPLSDPAAHGEAGSPAFHLVVPSLPGYGFSGPTTESGWTPRRMAAAFAELMAGLGYERYGAQGGDWGSVIASQLGLGDPEHVIGIHLNMIIAPRPADSDGAAGATDEELAEVEAMSRRRGDETGYQAIQGTRPQTLAYGLSDSPAGLAGWIVEKFRAWSDCDGDVESRFTRDQLLTNIEIYWVTGTIGSSTRLYYETRHGGGGVAIPDHRVEVPVGYARFPGDGYKPPRAWVERLYDIRRWTEMPSGGHFAALEEPDLLVDDIRAFYGELV